MEQHSYTVRSGPFEQLTEHIIAQHSPVALYTDSATGKDIFPESLQLNQGIFTKGGYTRHFPVVSVLQEDQHITLACSCTATHGQLCEPMAQVLIAILRREEFQVFFNPVLRRQMLLPVAADYGLEAASDLDVYFEPVFHHKLSIRARMPELTAVTTASMRQLQDSIGQGTGEPQLPAAHKGGQKTCVVLRQHKFYRYLVAELYQGAITKDGKLKNPLAAVAPLERLWDWEDADHVKFFTAIHKFQQHSDGKRSAADLAALRAIIKNPAGYDFYYHDAAVSENITALSIIPVKVASFAGSITLDIARTDSFYSISGRLEHRDMVYPLRDIAVKYNYFLLVSDTLYLLDQPEALGMADLLRQKQDRLLIHASKFIAFKKQVLDTLGDKIRIDYQYIRPATPSQLREQGFGGERQRIIYLSDSGDHVLIIPVLRYNDVEIPVRTKRQIHAQDNKGQTFLVERDDAAELALTSLVLQQHPHFTEQIDNDLYYFYLHKERFLAEEWFLDVFETWRQQGILVLGFNELEGNRRSAHKVKIDIKVLSGINWFNAVVQVRFGNKKASLKNIHKAIRNRNKYVQLDDGTEGLLPEEWITRFADYFSAGEIADAETLHIPRINFSAIEQYYEAQMLDETVLEEIQRYHRQLDNTTEIRDIGPPEGLLATLRPYQQQGLNWLNYLDDLNFGGCLADDMGLGKSVQVLAFILAQRKKATHNTNLVVAPTTLLFNWQEEVAKFAPSLKILTLYGADRSKSSKDFDQYEIILTSYGTLMGDIDFLKAYTFNYIFLDESQNIKNPETQRYKAVRLLQSRNKIVLTGTPIENNTFDLYSQLSFACPGLLGSKQHFRDIYSVPIDTFKVSKRAKELQQKIRPFVLRRTKEQVAPELPDKTEIVLYCSMDEAQRKIYDAYERQFREYISAVNNDELNKNPMHVLKGLTKLRQICNSPKLLAGDDLTGDTSAKMDVLMEQLSAKAPQHKILVFSQFVSMLDLIGAQLEQRGIGYARLTGSTRNRESVVNTFRHDPDTRIFLISLKAGGTGLNLTEADYVYLVDPWWNPAVENQAIDRVHRIGQTKKVIAVRLICPDTVEEKIMKMQATKRMLSEDLIRTETSFLKLLNKEDLLGLLH